MKILVIDVGGTFIKSAVMNERAEILRRGEKIPTPMTNRADFFKTIAGLYNPAEVEGIAMSLPGIIDADKGICITSGALEYNCGCNVVEELQKITGAKVTIENDAKCAALAEARIGALADVADGFVMIFGTSIGGAFIKNHELHKGKHNLAGEVCFSVVGDKIFHELGNVPDLLKGYAQIKNLSTENMSGEKFFQAVAENENDAVDCLNKFARHIANQIFNIQVIVDPEKVAIGGGISAQESFINAIRANLEIVYENCPFDLPHVEIVPCKFRNDANLIGALLRHFFLERNA